AAIPYVELGAVQQVERHPGRQMRLEDADFLAEDFQPGDLAAREGTIRRQQESCIDAKRTQRRRKRPRHVAQPAGLGERRAFRRDVEDARSGEVLIEIHEKKTPVGEPGSDAYTRTKGGRCACKGGKL